MSLISWIGDLFRGGRWTDRNVDQYEGDSIDHGDYTYEGHIGQLRERRPQLHHHQRLIVDRKIHELQILITAETARKRQAALIRDARAQAIMYGQQSAASRPAATPKTRATESTRSKSSYDVDVDYSPPERSSSSHVSSSHSHSHSSSSHSSCSHDSGGSSDSGGGGGGCD